MGDPNFQPGRIDADKVREKILSGFPAETEVLVQDTHGNGYQFQVWVSSVAFKGLSRIQQHQKVYELLKSEFQDALHALTLKTEIRG
ncbi:MAG: BolA/IbaG family iron-sulfur metabolism protein [Bdellovibrionota bacterium]